MKKNGEFIAKLIAHVNRKKWWHVPPRDRSAYYKRGKFLASTFREAEFWGRPLDEPQKVRIVSPLIGDEQFIEKELFGRQLSAEGMRLKDRWSLDARIKRAALAGGYDSVVLMTPKAFVEFRKTGKIPRSVELNLVHASDTKSGSNKKRNVAKSKNAGLK
jgi:hypothetical protein